ncbi:hypothetical protein G9A89_018285 [Geosiphon pyriformis]|nr:hypothetical protein G9A89_018285 [Geosiphon pyriformis]
MSKKKAPKGAFHGLAGGSFSQKKKVVLENVKHSGNKKDISLNRSELGNNVYSDVDSVSGDEKSTNMTSINVGFLLDSAANTLKAKRVNTGAVFGLPLGSPNFVMNDDEDVSFPSHLSISLKKKWIDPKIVKTQVEVLVKKSFALDINLSAVEEKSATLKTQFIRKLFSKINDFGGATTFSKFEGIIRSTFTSEESLIKEIPMDTPKGMIVAALSEFGQVKAVVEFAESSQADLLAARWSFLIGKDSVHMAKAASKNWFRVLLFTLPVSTTAHDLGNLLEGAGGKMCIINWSLKSGNRTCCAVVGFESDKILESAFHTVPILGRVKLSWARLGLVQCDRCGKLGYSVLECDVEIASTPKPPKSFIKWVTLDENCLQLAKLYVKKSVPIFCPAAFGGKS